MCSDGRARGVLLLALLAGLLAPPFRGTAAETPWPDSFEHCTPEMLQDAELRDVFFLDPDHGWAVGDRGVVLQTEDGGRHWRTQRVGDARQLESVHFVDAQKGWAVGGAIHPYTHRTSCVVLRTQDGGRTWKPVPDLTLPALKYVRFLDAQQGWAVGNGSTLYPTGIFRTEDGGRSWVPLPGGTTGKWMTAQFRDSSHGVVAGFDGALAVVSSPKVTPSATPGLGPRPLRAMRLRDGRDGWLVGDGGLVMQTGDAGLTWQNPPTPLPMGVKDVWDFHSLSVVGDHVWIAGAPGTLIVHSPDAGQTWELLPTDQHLPLRAITFVDHERGWAVGALGTVLATRDGGRTWRRQRSGGTRIALLGIFSEPQRVPLELFAQQSGDEGYLGFAEILNRRDIEIPSTDDAALEDACQAAMSVVGACGAGQSWRFPLRQEGLRFATQELIETWDRANDGRGIAFMEELVVRRIRQWRPEVIVTEAASPRGDRPLSHVINQIVQSAVANAADATWYPDHATVARLQPWTVKKVFCLAAADDTPTVTVNTSQLATRLGRSLSEQAADGYALVCPDYRKSSATLGFRLLHDQLPQASGRKDIFSGIYLQPGGEARRLTSQPAAGNLEALMRTAQKRRNMEQLVEATSGASATAAAWLGQVDDMTKSMTEVSAGQILYQLGQRYRQAGRLELAAHSLEQLVQRYPRHPLAESALAWLVQYYASGEIGWQLCRETQYSGQVAAAAVLETEVARGPQQADYRTSTAGPAAVGAVQSGMRMSGRATTAGIGLAQTERAEQALNFATQIQRGRPQLFAEPWVQFPMAVAYRVSGLPRDAERFYHRWSASPVPSDWARSAQAELWLPHGGGRPPKTSYLCKRAATRPHLDGLLDDSTWHNADHAELTSAQHDDSAWAAAAMVTYDDQFLYLAASCRKVPGGTYSSTPGPRPRDPDLEDRDRIDFYLDLDRDYTSFYRLSVDHRGWTGEACMGDPHWNPTWYVASTATDLDWTIEAAIPLHELAPDNPSRNDAWVIGVQRIAPGAGIQSFTKPAAVEPRGEGFALLLFQ